MYKHARQGIYKAANNELGLINPYSTLYELRNGNSYPWLGNSSTGMGVMSTPNVLPISRFGAKSKKQIGWVINKGKVVAVYKFSSLEGNRYYNKKKVPKTKKVYKTKSQASGKLKSKNTKRKQIAGYTLKGGVVVPVYKFNGVSGKYYSNGTKVPKNKKVTKTKLGVKRRTKKTNKSYMLYDIDGFNKRIKYINETYNCPKNTNSADCGGNPNCTWTSNRCVKKYGDVQQGPKGRDSKFGGNLINPSNGTNYSLFQYSTNSATPSLSQVNNLSGVSTYSYPTRMGNYSHWESINNTTGMGF